MKRRARARYSVRLPVTPVSAQSQVRNRAVRTEDQLTRWRSVAAGRRRAFELAQWVSAEQARRKRRRLVRGIRGVVTTVMVLALSVGAIAIQPGRQAEARAPSALLLQEASSVQAAVRTAAHDIAAAGTTVPSSLAAIEPVHLGVAMTVPTGPGLFVGPSMSIDEAPVSDVVGVDRDSVRQWNDASYRWVAFEVETEAPTWMRWRSPAGDYPIEDMPCAFPTETRHQCRAGRSHDRIARALRDGATAGTWTIEACVGGACEPVGRVEIGGR